MRIEEHIKNKRADDYHFYLLLASTEVKSTWDEEAIESIGLWTQKLITFR
jgi:hypothetical protein